MNKLNILNACFHYGCTALLCALQAIVSDIASAALCSAIYRYISLTVACNEQRSAAVVETGLYCLRRLRHSGVVNNVTQLFFSVRVFRICENHLVVSQKIL